MWLSVASFFHGRAPTVFEAALLAPMCMAGAAFRFLASFRNLSTALDKTTRVRFKTEIGDMEAEAWLLASRARRFSSQDF